MDVCPLSFCVVLPCVGRGLATGWSLVQGVLPYVEIAQETSYMWGGQGPSRTVELQIIIIIITLLLLLLLLYVKCASRLESRNQPTYLNDCENYIPIYSSVLLSTRDQNFVCVHTSTHIFVWKHECHIFSWWMCFKETQFPPTRPLYAL
jgi:hypothetical protein